MEKYEHIIEPAVERWSEGRTSPKVGSGKTDNGSSIFALSGGVMRSGGRTSNRIDGLLSMMMENPSTVKYIKDADMNLDYLFTSLQLDLIGRIATDVSLREEPVIKEEREEPGLSLERARSSV